MKAFTPLLLAWTLFATPPVPAQTAPAPDATPPAGPAAAEEPEAPEAAPGDHPGYAELQVDLTPSAGITVGDRVRADVVLVWLGPEPAGPPRFPTWLDTWGTAEILDATEVEAFVDQSGRRIWRQSVHLAAFRVGDVELPPVTVAVPLEDRTEELRTPRDLRFEVVSVLPPPSSGEDDGAADNGAADGGAAADEAAAEPLEPRPAAPPRTLETSLIYLLVAAAVAALIAWAAWRFARRVAAPAGAGAARKPRRAPLEELLERLRALDPAAASEPVHTGLSLALRDFLGRTLAIQALEATTSEIQRHLRATEIPAALAQRTVRLLRDCDQVKFARLEVDAATADDRVTRAQAMAREIDELLRREPEVEPAREAA